jgi:hypothetical protein
LVVIEPRTGARLAFKLRPALAAGAARLPSSIVRRARLREFGFGRRLAAGAAFPLRAGVPRLGDRLLRLGREPCRIGGSRPLGGGEPLRVRRQPCRLAGDAMRGFLGRDMARRARYLARGLLHGEPRGALGRSFRRVRLSGETALGVRRGTALRVGRGAVPRLLGASLRRRVAARRQAICSSSASRPRMNQNRACAVARPMAPPA